MNFQPTEQGCVVTYNYSDCFEDEQNYIDITLTILGKKINNRRMELLFAGFKCPNDGFADLIEIE